MKDERGLYYHPYPQNRKVRMYVKASDDTIWFRLWNQEDPELWMEHGWVPYPSIVEASKMYAGKNFDPRQAYDINVARELLETGR